MFCVFLMHDLLHSLFDGPSVDLCASLSGFLCFILHSWWMNVPFLFLPLLSTLISYRLGRRRCSSCLFSSCHPLWKLEQKLPLIASPISLSPIRWSTVAFTDAHAPEGQRATYVISPCVLSAPTPISPTTVAASRSYAKPTAPRWTPLHFFFISLFDSSCWWMVVYVCGMHMKAC
jgi:hypothetical protein